MSDLPVEPERAEEATASSPSANAGAENQARVVEASELAPEVAPRVAAMMAATIDVPALAEVVEQQDVADAAVTLESLEDEAADVLVAMNEDFAAEALSEMDIPLGASVLADLVDEKRTDYGASLLLLMAADDAVDLLQALDDDEREALLAAMPPRDSLEFRRLLAYGEETAGGLMTTEYLALDDEMTVAEAVEALRRSDIPDDLNELPVIDRANRLVGVVSLRALLLHRNDQKVMDFADRAFNAVRADVDQETVAREIERNDTFMLPVVDDADRLLGVVTVDDVIEAIREEQTEDVQRLVGAGAEEAVYSSVVQKFRGRTPWLLVSFLLSVPSAIIVLQFTGLIAHRASLAMVMPIVAALVGNAGHQALAVTLRGIILGEVRGDRVGRLLRRETIAGFASGLAIGVAMAVVALIAAAVTEGVGWQLAVVLVSAMPLAMAIGTLTGTGIPLLMRRLGFDPAQSSAIFLIMVTDAVAFAAFLGFAAVCYGLMAA